MKLSFHYKNSLYNFLEYILAFLLIIQCRSVWLHIDGKGSMYAKLILASVCTISVLCVLLCNVTWKKVYDAILLAVLWAGYFLIYILLVPYEVKNYIYLVAVFICLLLYQVICNSRTPYNLLYKYANIICFLAMTSIIIWFLWEILKCISATGYVYSNWSDTGEAKKIETILRIQYRIQAFSFGPIKNILRNTSCFVEAPMAALHFSIALLVEVYLRPNYSKIRCIVLCIAIITTFSTTGYVIMIMTIIIKFFLNPKRSKWVHLFKKMILPILFFLAVIIIYYLVTVRLSTEGSGSIRIDDYRIGLKSWLDNPLTGNGVDNYGALKQYMGAWRYNNTGYSNSVMMILAYGGIYLFIPYFIAFISGWLRSTWPQKAFSLSIMIILMVTIIPFQYITMLLLLVISGFKLDMAGGKE